MATNSVITSSQVVQTTLAPNTTTEGSVEFMKYIILPLFGVICIVGLMGNAMIMYIMQVKIPQKSITDIYVTNLAVADFIFLSMLPFWTVDMGMDGRWIFGRVLCKLTSGSTHFHMYASVFFLTAMSVDRLFAVVFYRHSQKLRSRRGALIGSIFVWFFSVVISSVPFHFRDLLYNNQTGVSRCVWMFSEKIPSHRLWFFVHFFTRSVIGFALPFVVIAACYSAIVIFLKTRKTSGRLTSKRQDRATTMVMVVILVFLVCWLPNQVSNVIYALQGLGVIEAPKTPSIVHYFVHMFSTCLAWGHSCVNPILYAFMREDLKLKMTEVIHSSMKHCCGSNISDRLLTSRKTQTPQRPPSSREETCLCWKRRKNLYEEMVLKEVKDGEEVCNSSKSNAPGIRNSQQSTTRNTIETSLLVDGKSYTTSIVR